MTDFEMDKMYKLTGREFLALLSLIPDGDEKAKAIVENVAGREKSEKVNESQNDFLKPCPFCGVGDARLSQDVWCKIYCPICGATMTDQSRQGVIDKWNRRYLNGMPISLHTMIPENELSDDQASALFDACQPIWATVDTGKTWVIGPDTGKGVDMKKINEEMWKELEEYEKREKDERDI